MRIFILLSAISIITACGGGGGGSTETTPPPVVVTPPPVTKTADLVSTTNFEFMSGYQLTIELPASKNSGRYFINVCTDYSTNEPIEVVYDSCKIRTFLESSTQTVVLTLSESERNLVAQIWPIEATAEPNTVYFNTTADNADWQILF